MPAARLQLSPLPQGECIETLEELRQWLEQARVELPAEVGYTSGFTEPSLEERHLPWLRESYEGKVLGWAVWDARLASNCGGWRCLECGTPGEIKTIARTEATVTADREAKSMTMEYGWQLADEKSLIDLTDNSAFFITERTVDEADVYSVIQTAI
jgi:hypothetical protein